MAAAAQFGVSGGVQQTRPGGDEHQLADLSGLQVRTLNSIALAIVNGSAHFRPPTGPPHHDHRARGPSDHREADQFPRKRNSDPVALWIEALSLARLGMRDPAEVEAVYDGDVDGFAAMLPRYRSELAAARSVDYDEQIVRAIEILLTDGSARAAAQRACRVLLVDEFQDLTPAHLLLVRLLAGPDGCVFGVGDDDQTIYGFNGADPQWLIDFAKYFPSAGEHPLQVNYRCPADVVSAAATLLQHNAAPGAQDHPRCVGCGRLGHRTSRRRGRNNLSESSPLQSLPELLLPTSRC